MGCSSRPDRSTCVHMLTMVVVVVMAAWQPSACDCCYKLR